jgi:ELWxxDGT repeat protein
VIGNRVVFFAKTDALGREPWVSDGSAQGTLPLADLFPGPGSSSIGVAEEGLDQTADLLLFSARVPSNSIDGGCPLFQTDGTPEGTDCVQPARAFSNAPGDFAPARSARFTSNGMIAFVAHERERGEEVFVIRDRDRLRSAEPDLRPGLRGSAPTDLLADGNDVFFGADDGLRGSELFKLSLDNVDRLFGNGFEDSVARR